MFNAVVKIRTRYASTIRESVAGIDKIYRSFWWPQPIEVEFGERPLS